MSTADLLLLASGPLLYGALTLILWYRGVHKLFPFFFAYNVFAVVASAIRLAVASNALWYFYAFWWTELGLLALGIAALHEAFRAVFEGFYLLRWFRWLYFGGIGAVLCVSILNSIFNRPVQVQPLFGVILGIDMPINCIQAAIFGLFYVSGKLLSVNFKPYPFAIVLGFGISAIGTLIPLVLRSIVGKKLQLFAVYAPSVAYYITLLIWFSAFLRPEPEEDEKVPPLSPQEMADEVTQYTRVLKGFFGNSHEF